MDGKIQDYITFFLTGRLDGGSLMPMDPVYRPAAFGPYSDLTSLRYDFPLVLNRADAGRALQSLSHLVDDAVADLADDPERDRIARHGYAIEMDLRRELDVSGSGDFHELWHAASDRLSKEREDAIKDSADLLWNLFNTEGIILDAERSVPFRAVRHLWSAVQADKAKDFRRKTERLLLKLRGILNAEVANSATGRAPEALRAGVGAGFTNAFDFTGMSKILMDSKPISALSDGRRQRIRDLIEVLEGQKFFSLGNEEAATYEFAFECSSEALKAYKERHAEAVSLTRALKMAELEAAGEYRERMHDRIFEGFGERGLGFEDLAELPDYLVCAEADELDAQESSGIVEMLSAGIPVKIIVRTDDALQPSPVAEGHANLGGRSKSLVDLAIGLADVFVLQAGASQLFKERDGLVRGLSYTGPSLFSVYSGSGKESKGIPAYLASAAATESRVFPSLTYDPSAGHDWSSRMSVGNNPSPEDDWPDHRLRCQNSSLQAETVSAPFTPADLMATDARYFNRFAIVPDGADDEGLVPLNDLKDFELEGLPEEVPYIMLVGEDNRLRKAVVDLRTLTEVRRCLAMWHSLQELGGIHNSHAERLLAKERSERALDVTVSEAPLTVAVTVGETATAEPEEVEDAIAEPVGDDPFIETARCTSCDECIQINGKMFAYDENKQAYIADPDAGTFRQLVEAAEGCQVSIIHTGKPRNPNEPGIEDLIKRAEDFQ